MSDLTFEQRQRLETEVLPAVIDDPEYAAATIVRLEARVAELEADNKRLREAGAGYSQQTVDALSKERDTLRARAAELEACVEELEGRAAQAEWAANLPAGC